MPAIPLFLLVVALPEAVFIWRHHMFVFGIISPTRFIAVSIALIAALLASYLPRLFAAVRFKQPLKSAVLHPLGILALLALQWYALARQVLGRPVGWRARTYASTDGTELPEDLTAR